MGDDGPEGTYVTCAVELPPPSVGAMLGPDGVGVGDNEPKGTYVACAAELPVPSVGIML